MKKIYLIGLGLWLSIGLQAQRLDRSIRHILWLSMSIAQPPDSLST